MVLTAEYIPIYFVNPLEYKNITTETPSLAESKSNPTQKKIKT